MCPWWALIAPHLSPVVVDGEVLPGVGVPVDLAVDGGTDLLRPEDALLSLFDLLHDLRVVAQLSASFPEHLYIVTTNITRSKNKRGGGGGAERGRKKEK